MKTVIIVNDQAKTSGGASKVALVSAMGLARRGYRVIVFAGSGPVDPQLNNVPNLSVECLGGFEILDDPNRLRAITAGIWNPRARTRLMELIRDHSGDDPIVHFHGWMKSLSPAVLDGAHAANARMVVTLHDYFTACPTGGFYHHGLGEVCHRTPLGPACLSCNCDPRAFAHKVWRVARSSVQKFWARYPACCEHFILLSPLSRRVLEPFLPPRAQRYMLDNPISATNENRTPAENNDVFLLASRLVREKGILQLAEAARHTSVKIVVVGDGGLRQEAERLMPAATFTGWLDEAGVMSWMRRARALLFPSTWYEVQPLAPIEAAARGIPTIMSDCVAATDYLPHGERGIHFQQGRVPAFVEAIRQAEDGDFIRRLSQNCYDWYWANPWTLEKHLDGLESIYAQIATDGGPAHRFESKREGQNVS